MTMGTTHTTWRWRIRLFGLFFGSNVNFSVHVVPFLRGRGGVGYVGWWLDVVVVVVVMNSFSHAIGSGGIVIVVGCIGRSSSSSIKSFSSTLVLLLLLFVLVIGTWPKEEFGCKCLSLCTRWIGKGWWVSILIDVGFVCIAWTTASINLFDLKRSFTFSSWMRWWWWQLLSSLWIIYFLSNDIFIGRIWWPANDCGMLGVHGW